MVKLHPRLGVPPPRAKIITSHTNQTSPTAKRVTQGKVMFDKMQSTVQEPSVKPLMAPFSLSHSHTGAPFKREPSVIESVIARYHNDQHDETSSMVSRSAPYDCLVQPPFKPIMALFSLLQCCTGAPFKRELLVIEK